MHTLEIQLPDDLYFRITQQNQPASKFIVAAIEDKVRKAEADNLHELLAFGYTETRKEDLEIAEDFSFSEV